MTDTQLEKIAELATSRIEKQCSYVPVNKKALGSTSKTSAIETLRVFVMPEIEERSPLSDRGFLGALMRDIDNRIAEIEREENVLEGKTFSLQAPSRVASFEHGTGELRTRSRQSPREIPLVDIEKILQMPGIRSLVQPSNASANQGEEGTKILVEAGAGFGKSMLLNRLALSLAPKPHHQRTSHGELIAAFEDTPLPISSLYGKIPFLIRCRDFKYKAIGERPLCNLLLQEIFPEGEITQTHIPQSLQGESANNYVILIDGLDELPTSIKAEELIEAIHSLFGSSPNERSALSVVACSRPISEPLRAKLFENGFTFFRIKPLNAMSSRESRNRFIRELSRKWYEPDFECDSPIPEHRANSLCQSIESEWDLRFSNYLRSPLDLVLLLVLYSNAETLPATEHDLFMDYIHCRLHWRQGASSPDDLLLQLSYCASRAQSEEGTLGGYRFEKETLLDWICDSYGDLESRIADYEDRGLESAAKAAALDLDDLINTHGILSETPDGKIEFEHRIVQNFLCENAFALGAYRPEFASASYARTYAEKMANGTLNEDWGNIFRFFVQDPRIERKNLALFWQAMIQSANPSEISKQEGLIYLACLLDGRISESEQLSHLDSMLTTFASKHISSKQLDGYRKIAIEPQYKRVTDRIKSLYEASRANEQHLFGFVMATLCIFEFAFREDDSLPMPIDHASRIVNLGITGLEDPIKTLQCLEILLFFRQIGKDSIPYLSFADYFFDNGNSACNKFVESALIAGVQNFNESCSLGGARETARCISELLEDHTCKSFLLNALSADSDMLSAFFESFGKHFGSAIDKATRDDGDSDVSSKEDVMESYWLAILEIILEAKNDIRQLSHPYLDSIEYYVRKCYVESMRWAANTLFSDASESAGTEPPEETAIDKAIVQNVRGMDSGIEAFIDAAKQKNPWAFSGMSQAKLYSFRPSDDLRAVREAVERHADNVYPKSIELDNLRKLAISFIVSVYLGHINTEGISLFVGKLIGTLQEKYHKQLSDKNKYGYPGESLKMVLQNEVFKKESIKEQVLDALSGKNRDNSGFRGLKFIAIDGSGKHIECEALFMYDFPETGKSYIVYTDNSLDEDGNLKVYASICNPEQLMINEEQDLASLELLPIESDTEWNMIETILESMPEATEEHA